jgi:hypothetical protein
MNMRGILSALVGSALLTAVAGPAQAVVHVAGDGGGVLVRYDADWVLMDTVPLPLAPTLCEAAVGPLASFAVDPATRDVVAEEEFPVGAHSVFRFDWDGNLLDSFSPPGTDCIVGLAVDPSNGDILVGRSDLGSSGSVGRFDSQGSFIGEFPVPPVNLDLAVDPATGDILVGLFATNTLERYDSAGNWIGVFPTAVLLGTGVDVDPATGDILVADPGGLVERWSSAGAFLGSVTLPHGVFGLDHLPLACDDGASHIVHGLRSELEAALGGDAQLFDITSLAPPGGWAAFSNGHDFGPFTWESSSLPGDIDLLFGDGSDSGLDGTLLVDDAVGAAPGGWGGVSDPADEDDFQLTFDPPVRGAGLLTIDNWPEAPEAIEFFDVQGQRITRFGLRGVASGSGGAGFFGVEVCPGHAPIERIVVNEGQERNDDISFRDVVYAPVLVPTPTPTPSPTATATPTATPTPTPVPDIHLPDLTGPPYAHDFGSVPLGTEAQWNLRIQNVGTAPLAVRETNSDNVPVFLARIRQWTPASLGIGLLALGGLGRGRGRMRRRAWVGALLLVGLLGVLGLPRSSEAGRRNFAIVIQPGDAVFVPVFFTPDAPGPHSATLTIVSNDPDEPAVEVSLTGNGV